MKELTFKQRAWLLAGIAALLVSASVACGGGDETASPAPRSPTATPPTATPTTPVATATPTATTTAENTATETPGGHDEGAIAFVAAQATPTIDGDNADWAGIEGVTFEMEQIEIPPGSDIEFDPVEPKDATLKVATDGTNIYVLLEVEDTFDYVPDDHGLSASMAVMFRIDEAAAAHMGSSEEDLETSLGMVDIWHWELDCGPGEISGGQGAAGGDDAACNLDDEYATTPEDREDDGKGDAANAAAENGLAGAWTHTASAPGGAGTWIFEMSRPLNTGDPQDAQLSSGQVANVAIAYWDPKESTEGWSDAGHVTSAELGWIEVSLP